MSDFVDIRTAKVHNPAGTMQVLYFAPVDDFLTIGAPSASPATLAERNVIATDHTFDAADGFLKLELEVDKQDLMGEYIGNVLGADQAFNFTGFATGMSDEQMALMEMISQHKHIVLVPTKDNKLIQLGGENNGVLIKPSLQVGKESDGERGYNVAITFYGRALRYDGTVTFKP